MSLPADKELDVRDCYKLFDHDKKGITKSQVGDLMRALGLHPDDSELKVMLENVKLNENGRVSVEEFLKLFKEKYEKPYTEDQLVEAFRMFDRDGNGIISKDELGFILRNFGNVQNETDIEDFLHEADLNGDGNIDYKEFVKYTLSHH